MTKNKAADPEMVALKAAFKALKHLELDEVRRVLEWLESRLIADAKKRQHEIEVRRHEAERRRLAEIEVPF